MRDYLIALPMHSNTGADYRLERERWEALALRLAGGYTRDALPACGAWAHEGHVYKEAMQGYHVATNPGTWAKLARAAFDMFPDQLAFYTVTGGTVVIHPRPKAKEAT